MIRKIIKIDEKKCNGCGACASACHEGAIGMVNGKAHLLKDDYCDGLGDCLPACPAGAISFEEREAAAYDEAAVKARMAARATGTAKAGTDEATTAETETPRDCPPDGHSHPAGQPISVPASCLSQWPIQIKLAPITAPFFDRADLLVAADCTAYAYGNFHHDFIRGAVTLIGCPKLDAVDYAEKLAEIIRSNELNSITVVRMEVPCCGGIEYAIKQALKASGKTIPCQVVTISIDGRILKHS